MEVSPGRDVAWKKAYGKEEERGTKEGGKKKFNRLNETTSKMLPFGGIEALAARWKRAGNFKTGGGGSEFGSNAYSA